MRQKLRDVRAIQHRPEAWGSCAAEIQEGEVDRMSLTLRPNELEYGRCVTLGKSLPFSGPSFPHHKVGLMTSAPGGGVRFSIRRRSVEFFAQT